MSQAIQTTGSDLFDSTRQALTPSPQGFGIHTSRNNSPNQWTSGSCVPLPLCGEGPGVGGRAERTLASIPTAATSLFFIKFSAIPSPHPWPLPVEGRGRLAATLRRDSTAGMLATQMCECRSPQGGGEFDQCHWKQGARQAHLDSLPLAGRAGVGGRARRASEVGQGLRIPTFIEVDLCELLLRRRGETCLARLSAISGAVFAARRARQVSPLRNWQPPEVVILVTQESVSTKAGINPVGRSV